MFLGPRAATGERRTHWRMTSWLPRRCCGSLAESWRSPDASRRWSRILLALRRFGRHRRVGRRTCPAGPASVDLPLRMADASVSFRMAPDALWLHGLWSCACRARVPPGNTGAPRTRRMAVRCCRAACLAHSACSASRTAAFFLVAWELMSLGGAVMILSERLAAAPVGRCCSCWRMLEVGAVRLAGGVHAHGAAGAAACRSRLSPRARRSCCRSPCRSSSALLLVDRLRRQARPAAVLRMVSGRLRLGQRRVRRAHVGRRAECRVLRPQPRPAGLAAGPCTLDGATASASLSSRSACSARF